MIVSFVCGSLQPFSLVEEESFRNLINGLAPSRKIMCRKTLAVKLREKHDYLKNSLIEKLAEQSSVCITADCWSHFSRSYLGMTVHWVNSKTLKRESAMLAVQRLKGRHTFDVLAAAIENICRSFGIQNKVTLCVTDNGSNLVKAFTMFGEKHGHSEEEEDDCDVQFVEVGGILDGGVQNFQYMLPRHQRCAAHTLNLVATKDAQQAENDGVFKKISRSAFAKCQALWNKQRSTVCVDSIKAAFNKLLSVPTITRWNSMYESVHCLVVVIDKFGQPVMDSLVDSIGLARFRPAELAFLKEYILAIGKKSVGRHFEKVFHSYGRWKTSNGLWPDTCAKVLLARRC